MNEKYLVKNSIKYRKKEVIYREEEEENEREREKRKITIFFFKLIRKEIYNIFYIFILPI